ncbi:PQQ-binding-like beta-propeller repeat protein [Halobacteriovorax sp. GB3]|uniref:outer membrane protein assembly factor BamB family protein n=1 Tax=Halobacteriovorax sp. GB3 TaxID=2719615 RepID=UPI002362691B|nr:PQQ-binding-like beta-propeller repeat protein [Halobacteriovorax sp. GB3]MDD0852569.1 PQQ-binding-like beta-propeller repeat protein [Halobacteriovorax sp. GB3]
MEELLLSNIQVSIIPTVLIPLSLVSFALSMVASFIAGLFGIKLKTEGAKKLVELVVKPKFIIFAIISNFVFLGLFKGYDYVKTLPHPLFYIQYSNDTQISNQFYENSITDKFEFERNLNVKKTELNEQLHVKLESGAFYMPLVTEKSFFFGTKNGDLLEIDRKSFKVLRKLKLGTFIPSGLIIHNNHLYTGEGVHTTHHARIYKIKLKDFTVDNIFTTKGHTEGTATLLSDSLIFPAGGDGVYRIETKSLEKIWHAKIGHTDSQALVESEAVYIGTGLDKVDPKERAKAFALEKTTGEIIWKRDLIASSWFKPIAFDKRVCFVTGEIYFKSEISGLECFERSSGKPVGTYRSLSPLTSLPILLGENFVFAKRNGEVCSIKAKNLVENWCQKTANDGHSYSSIMYDKFRDLLVYATRASGLFTLDPDSGKLIQHLSIEGWKSTFARPLVLEEGIITIDLEGNIRRFN